MIPAGYQGNGVPRGKLYDTGYGELPWLGVVDLAVDPGLVVDLGSPAMLWATSDPVECPRDDLRVELWDGADLLLQTLCEGVPQGIVACRGLDLFARGTLRAGGGRQSPSFESCGRRSVDR